MWFFAAVGAFAACRLLVWCGILRQRLRKPDELRPKIEQLKELLSHKPMAVTNDEWTRHSRLEMAVDQYACKVADVEAAIEDEELEAERQRSGRAAREKLARKNWRDLRGVPFEDFVQELAESLQWQTETTPTTGDHGIDLILIKGTERLAVQVKGYAGSVGNSAVQEAVAGVKLYKCTGCMVVTNSTFTRQAQELAKANECRLVDGNDLRAVLDERRDF